jgi:nitroreductase
VPVLPLSPDELLTTTRAVRKRLDLTRPVEDGVVLECLALAQQAPQGGNREPWQFVVVTDADRRAALAGYYRQSIDVGYGGPPPREHDAATALAERHRGDQPLDDYLRILDSVIYLYDHLQDVPVHVVPCVPALPDGEPSRGFTAAGRWGGVVQGAWSFMLAARSRGLGTVWTTAHLRYEREVAELLGIPYESYMQTALIPLAYTKGTDFRPGRRRPLDTIVRWNRW